MYKKVLCFSLLVSLFLTSCDSFLQGSNLKNELEAAIEDASAERYDVTIFAYNHQGTLKGETGGTYKKGAENYILDFSENKGWQFAEWQVLDKAGNKTGCTSSDSIYIKNPLSAKTTFSITGAAAGYRIEAVCMARPNVEVFSPSYIANGINGDSPIEITFAHEVAEESFVFSEAEFAAYGKFAKAVRMDLQDASSAIVGIDLAGDKIYKNISITDSNGNNISSHYKAPVLSENKKKVTLEADTSKPFDFSSSSTKDVFVILSSKISYAYKAQNEKTVKIVPEKKYDFNYKVSATTTAKARIILSAKNEEDKVMGTLNYNGQQEFNIGQTVKIEFEPNNDFEFVGWDIQGNEDNAVSANAEGSTLILNVLKATDSVKIEPVCEGKSQAQLLFTSTNGTMNPSGYVKCTQGQVIPLSFSCDPSYTFVQWKVVNTNTNETVDPNVADFYYHFDDVNAQSTFVTIKNPKDVYSIVADCYVRPHVYSHYPDINSGTAVPRDQSVKIYFDHDMDKMSFYYSEEEAVQIQKVSGFSGFLTDSAGRYGYKTSDGNQCFKNFSITNRATGENYTKYYKQPELIDPRTLVVPVNIVLSSGKVDETKSLPKFTEVMFEVGDKVGYYAENGQLVPLVFDSNLTWFYTNNGTTDATKPEIVSCSLVTNGVDPKPLSKTEPVDKPTLKAAYLSSGLVNYDVIVKDTSGNLSSLTLKYQRIKTLGNTLDTISEPVEYSKALNLVSSEKTNGTCSATVNLFGLTGTYYEGVYKYWFEVSDESGNTSSSTPYYVVRDDTAPGKTVDIDTIKHFKGGDKIMFCDWKFLEKPFDYESTTMYITPMDTMIETAYSMDNVNQYILISSEVRLRIVSKDVFGNETEFYYKASDTNGYKSYIKNGDYFYTNGWYSTKYYSDYTKCGTFIKFSPSNNFDFYYVLYDGPTELLTKKQAEDKLRQLNNSLPEDVRSRITWTYPQEDLIEWLKYDYLKNRVGVDPYKNNGDWKDNNFWMINESEIGFAYYRYSGYPNYKYEGPKYRYNVSDTDKGYLIVCFKY